jgi:hypothetical protein
MVADEVESVMLLLGMMVLFLVGCGVLAAAAGGSNADSRDGADWRPGRPT